MENLSDFLRTEREKKDITLEQIAKDTKISKGILYAIESNSFEDLPGGFFNIGILRAYAKYIGIDDNAVIAEYKKIYEKEDEKSFFEEIKQEKIGFPFDKKKVAIIFILIFLLFFLVWFFYPTGISTKDVVSIGNSMKSVSGNSSNKTIKKETLKSDISKKTESNIRKSSFNKNSENKINSLNISLTFKEQCWIEIKKAGTIIVSKLFFPGDSFVANGQSFDIKLGAPSATRFFINGQQAIINTNTKRPLSFKLNLQNYKQYLKNE